MPGDAALLLPGASPAYCPAEHNPFTGSECPKPFSLSPRRAAAAPALCRCQGRCLWLLALLGTRPTTCTGEQLVAAVVMYDAREGLSSKQPGQHVPAPRSFVRHPCCAPCAAGLAAEPLSTCSSYPCAACGSMQV